MEKKFYQTDTFKFGLGIAVGMLLYKIITVLV
jgi:hypothetical protein